MWTSPSLLFYILTQGLIVINMLTWRWARSCLESCFSLYLGSPAFSAWEWLVLGWQERGGGRSQPDSRGKALGTQFELLHVPAHSGDVLPSGSMVCPTPAQHVMLCVLESTSHAWLQSLFLILNWTPAQMCFCCFHLPGSRCTGAWTDLLSYPRDFFSRGFLASRFMDLQATFQGWRKAKA